VQLIDQLPQTARVMVAQVEDEDLAMQVHLAGMAGDDSGEWVPSLREYDTTAVLLQQMLDVLQGANYQRGGGKGGRPKPSKRPTTAMQRVRDKADYEKQRGFLEYMLSNARRRDGEQRG